MSYSLFYDVGVAVVAAYSEEEASELYKKGADYVVLPDQMAGEYIIASIIGKKRSQLWKFRKQGGSRKE